MMRLLIWLVIGAAVVTWIMRLKSGITQSGSGRTRQDTPRPTQNRPESMLQCAACGVHFPASEALIDDASGAVFCCAEHRTARKVR